MDLNLLGLQNPGFLTNSDALNYLTTKRFLEKSYALKVFTQQLGVLILPAVHVLSFSCKIFYIWKGPGQKQDSMYRTQKKIRPEAIDLGLCSPFSLAHFPWLWVARYTYFWRNSEQLDILRGAEGKMVTSGCSFYVGCKSQYNTQCTASILNKCRQICSMLLALSTEQQR